MPVTLRPSPAGPRRAKPQERLPIDVGRPKFPANKNNDKTFALFTFPLRLVEKHLYTFEKQKIYLFNNIFQDIYIYSHNNKLYLLKVINI
jgi:hypothetical protein